MITLFLICSFTGTAQLTPEQEQQIDSLKKVIETAKHDSIVINAWKAWDNIIYIFNTELDLELNKKITDLSSVNLAKKLSKKEKYFFQNSMAYGLNGIGIIYYQQANYPKALDYYFRSLKIKEEIGDKSGIATTLGNIGVVYDGQSDYSKALDYYFRSLKIKEEAGDKTGIATMLGNIGVVYKEQGDYTRALDYYSRSLKMKEETGDKKGIAITLGNIGNVYFVQSDFSRSLEFYSQSLKIKEEMGDKNGIATTLANMGVLYVKTGRFKDAEKHFKKSLALNDSLADLEIAKEVHQRLSHLYDTTGRHKLAFEHYKKYIAASDSINSGENLKNQTRIEMNYEFEKKEATAKAEQEKKDALAKAEQEKKDEINRAEKKRQQLVIILVSCVLVIVMVFAVFIFRSLRTTRKQKVIIETQKAIVEEKHKEITDSINYAERIQRSFLASDELLDRNLKKYFVFFKPRDVVSGDFYFACEQKNGNFLLACADSTGHGVPGAIMSILNISSLEKAIKNETEPAKILNEARKLIIDRLKKDGSLEGGKDGMDCSLVSFDFKNMKMDFALANVPLWIIRENNIIEFPPDKMPVGRHQKENILFAQQSAELKKDDLVILLTDGFADQFGGPKGKKFKYSNLKKLLLEPDLSTAGSAKVETRNPKPETLNHQPTTLNTKLETEFNLWKRNFEQTDDVCIIGVKI